MPSTQFSPLDQQSSGSCLIFQMPTFPQHEQRNFAYHPQTCYFEKTCWRPLLGGCGARLQMHNHPSMCIGQKHPSIPIRQANSEVKRRPPQYNTGNPHLARRVPSSSNQPRYNSFDNPARGDDSQTKNFDFPEIFYRQLYGQPQPRSCSSPSRIYLSDLRSTRAERFPNSKTNIVVP